jgi:hypothetical protein
MQQQQGMLAPAPLNTSCTAVDCELAIQMAYLLFLLFAACAQVKFTGKGTMEI